MGDFYRMKKWEKYKWTYRSGDSVLNVQTNTTLTLDRLEQGGDVSDVEVFIQPELMMAPLNGFGIPDDSKPAIKITKGQTYNSGTNPGEIPVGTYIILLEAKVKEGTNSAVFAHFKTTP